MCQTTNIDPDQVGYELLRKLLDTGPIMIFDPVRIRKQTAAQTIFAAPPADKVSFIHCANEFLLAAELESEGQATSVPPKYARLLKLPADPKIAALIMRELLKARLPLSQSDVLRMLVRTVDLGRISLYDMPHLPRLVELMEHYATSGPLMESILEQARRLARLMSWAKSGKEKGLRERLEALNSDSTIGCIQPGEAWSDVALASLRKVSGAQREKWIELLVHSQTPSGGKPSALWLKKAAIHLRSLGAEIFKRQILIWFPLVDKPRTQEITNWNREWQPDPNQLIIEPHADILKGLIWCCALREDKDIARALVALALSAYRKLPKIGPRAVKIGNACVYALGAMPGLEGVGQLALLKVRVKFGTAQKMIEKALTATAHRVGLPRAELEEMAVPTYGLTDVGVGETPMGEFTARFAVTGIGGTEILWLKPDGKTQKSVPASAKAEHAEELRELRGTAKDIQRMLPAQRERIDTLFLQQKSWPLAVWRERYLDHPLVGVLARRLLWEFTTGVTTSAGIWFDRGGEAGKGQSGIVDFDLRPMAHLGASTTVRLWHPIGQDIDDILAWRAWLDDQ